MVLTCAARGPVPVEAMLTRRPSLPTRDCGGGGLGLVHGHPPRIPFEVTRPCGPTCSRKPCEHPG